MANKLRVTAFDCAFVCVFTARWNFLRGRRWRLDPFCAISACSYSYFDLYSDIRKKKKGRMKRSEVLMLWVCMWLPWVGGWQYVLEGITAVKHHSLISICKTSYGSSLFRLLVWNWLCVHVLHQLPVPVDQRQMWASWQSSGEQEATSPFLLSPPILSCSLFPAKMLHRMALLPCALPRKGHITHSCQRTERECVQSAKASVASNHMEKQAQRRGGVFHQSEGERKGRDQSTLWVTELKLRRT